MESIDHNKQWTTKCCFRECTSQCSLLQFLSVIITHKFNSLTKQILFLLKYLKSSIKLQLFQEWASSFCERKEKVTLENLGERDKCKHAVKYLHNKILMYTSHACVFKYTDAHVHSWTHIYIKYVCIHTNICSLSEKMKVQW